MNAASVSKILLVEDHEISREMLTRRLERRGYSVCCAVDGPMAVFMAADELPDVILMDVALGEMDGWEATTCIKENPVTNFIPIIALTAHALDSDRRKSIEVGCSDFDTKPVDIERLIRKITEVARIAQVTREPAIDGDERRIASRRRTLKSGAIEFGGVSFSCVVRNISDTGANLEVTSCFGSQRHCDLMIDGEKQKRSCIVVWSTQTRIGVRFL